MKNMFEGKVGKFSILLTSGRTMVVIHEFSFIREKGFRYFVLFEYLKKNIKGLDFLLEIFAVAFCWLAVFIFI